MQENLVVKCSGALVRLFVKLTGRVHFMNIFGKEIYYFRFYIKDVKEQFECSNAISRILKNANMEKIQKIICLLLSLN
jgi:hypothetical protein